MTTVVVTQETIVEVVDVGGVITEAPVDGTIYSRQNNNWVESPGSSGGEANTNSNQGSGEGLALAKVGSDLPLKTLTNSSTIVLLSTATEIQIAVIEGNLTITSTQVSDFNVAVSANSTVTANSAKISADGSVTTHSDITSGGSGDIITTAERSAIGVNTAKISADGSVTTHSDITDAGSGDIITTAERDAIGVNTAKVTNQTHTGEVTGATTLTIANNVVTNAKLSTVVTSTIKGRIAPGSGDVEDLASAQVRTIINVEDGATANDTNANLRDRSTHSGTQLSGTISDFDSSVSSNPTVITNSAKISADGSVTTHSDVTDAGSGDIITTAERSAIGVNFAKISADGSVTTHSDITSGGSGDIITTVERSAIGVNTAKISADGSVTTHSDVTSAGSGDIITTAERAQITDRTQHSGDSIYNDESILFETSSFQVGGSLATASQTFFVGYLPSGSIFDPSLGGIEFDEAGFTAYGTEVRINSLQTGEFKDLQITPQGVIYAAELPTPGWEITNTDNGDYDLGTGTSTGPWVEVTGLTTPLTNGIDIGDRIDVAFGLYAVNVTSDRSGFVELGFSTDTGTPQEPINVAFSQPISPGFEGFISGSFSTIATETASVSDNASLWARITGGSHNSFGVLIDGDPQQHDLLISSPGESGSSGEANTTTNEGAGSQLALLKSGVNLPFRTIINTSELTVTQNPDNLAFDLVTNSIAFNKIIPIAQNLILGRSAVGVGDIEALSSTDVRGVINVADGATANDTDANLRDRSTHTGTQLSNTISDFDSSVNSNSSVVANTAKISADGSVTTHSDITSAGSGDIITVSERGEIGVNTAKVTNQTHTGEVTGSATLTIANNVVTNAKLSTVATSTIKGRIAPGSGDVEDLTSTQVRTIINVADGATANDTDANLRDRSTHSGTQLSNTISDFQATVSANSDLNALKLEPIDGGYATVQDGTLTVSLSALYSYVINQIFVHTDSGTCSLTVSIDGASITGLSGIAVSSTVASPTASGANVVAIGEKLTFTFASSSSVVNLFYTLSTTRV